MSLVFTAAVAGFSINTKRIWSRRLAIGSTSSAVTPKAAVNHTEFALSRIRRTYQPSNSAALRGENSRTIDFSEITSAGLGVSAIAPSLAPASSGSVFTSFQYSKYCFAVAESATRCLAEKARGGEIGRTCPHLDRIGAAPEMDDELVLRDLGSGAAKGGLLVINRKTRRLHGGFVGLSGRVGRVVIDDLHVDAAVDGSLELVEDRL